MNITRFSRRSLRNEEYFRHKTETVEAVNNSGIDAVSTSPIMATFVQTVEEVDLALEIIRKSSYTEEINEADSERDITTSGLVKTVVGLTKHFDPLKRKQAKQIQIILDHYKGINQQSVVSQTGSTVNMLQALREKQELLTQLGINEWVNQVEATNNKVAELTMNRFDEAASKPTQRMKEARPVCDEQLNKLYNAIETFAQITPGSNYNSCISLLNSINKKYIDTIAQRQGISEAGKKKKNEE